MKTQRRNLTILTFVLFVVMLGYGIIIPIFPFYIEGMGAGGNGTGAAGRFVRGDAPDLWPDLGRTL